MNEGLLKREKIVLISVLTIVFIVGLFLLLPTVFAAEIDGQGFFDKLVQFYSIQGARDALGLSAEGIEGTLYEKIADISEPFIKAMSGIGVIWVTALMIYSVIKEFSMGDASMSMWLKVLIKIAIGIFLIVSVSKILSSIDAIGVWIIDEISNAPFAESADTGSVALGDLGGSLLIAVFSMFLIAYIKICSYALMLEIGLRRVFAPIAVGSIVTHGARSAGVKFFRKYLAVYMKMAIMIMTMLLGGILVKSILESQSFLEVLADSQTPGLLGVFSNQIITVIAILCSCTTFIGKGAKLADELVNAA